MRIHDRLSAIRERLDRVRGAITRRRSDEDLERELRSHLELAAEAQRPGHAADDRLRTARLKAGGVAHAMETLREQRGLPLLENLVRDVRYGLRTLRRSPVFTVVAVLTLALGIGANAAIFQLLEAIRFSALPVKSPSQLVVLTLADMTRWEGRRTTGYPALTNPLWEELRDRQDIFTGTLAWSNAQFRLDDDGTPHEVRGLFVSGDFFQALGVESALGRVFTAADDRPGCGRPGAVVSHRFWQRQLGGDPAAIGRTLSFAGSRVDVIGVTPPGFFGVEVGRPYDVAVPICAVETLGSERGWLRDGTTWWLTVMGRVPPDMTLAQVNAQLEAASPGLFGATLPERADPARADGYSSLKLRAEPAAGGVSALRARFTDPLLMLAGVAGLVLLIVCINLASLVLSRASARQREFAVRQSLGASRGRLVQQLMVENVLVAIAGAALGLTLAGTLSGLLVAFLGPEVSVPVRIDARLLGVVTITIALTSLIFGLLPAWRASRTGAPGVWRSAGLRGSSAGAEETRFRKLLVVSQVALSLVLLFGALLFTGTLRNLLAVDSGYHAEGVAVARMDFSRSGVATAKEGVFRRELLARIRHTPGVRSAAEVRHVPMSGTGSSVTVWLDGSHPDDKTTVRLNAISDGYLQTMGIPLLSGRDFTPQDSMSSTRVAIVNRAFVRRLGLAGNPVGSRLRAEGSSATGPEIEIVGLVPDTKYFSLREDAVPVVFVPITQITDPRAVADVVIRPGVPLAEMAPMIRRRLQEMSPAVGLDVRALDSMLQQGLVREKLLAAISAFFGVLAVVIAAVGLYGVMAESVTRRRGEIGIRLALGAQRSDVLAMILRQAAGLLLIGIGAGTGLAFLAAGFARPFVFGLEPHDLQPMVLSWIFLVVPAITAMLVPACRAAWVEPLAALRDP